MEKNTELTISQQLNILMDLKNGSSMETAIVTVVFQQLKILADTGNGG